jgi:protein SCO1/2
MTSRRSPRRSVPVLVGVLALSVGVGVFGTSSAQTSPAGADTDAAALRQSQAAIGNRTGAYRLVDQQGREFSVDQLRGRPVVLNLVFTNCYSVCSGLTLRLREAVRVARDALGANSFTVVTVGFDTARDTTARMAAYGRDRGINDPLWYFASTDAATVQRLTDTVGFTWRPSAAGFDHIAQVTLLDRDGVVVRQLYGAEFEPPELVEPLRALVLGRGLERLSVSNLLTRVQLYCSVYDPATGRYRFDFSMLAAAIPALLAVGIAVFAMRAARRRER